MLTVMLPATLLVVDILVRGLIALDADLDVKHRLQVSLDALRCVFRGGIFQQV